MKWLDEKERAYMAGFLAGAETDEMVCSRCRKPTNYTINLLCAECWGYAQHSGTRQDTTA